MAYKIMGVTAGRKNSNSEILLKEALIACHYNLRLTSECRRLL